MKNSAILEKTRASRYDKETKEKRSSSAERTDEILKHKHNKDIKTSEDPDLSTLSIKSERKEIETYANISSKYPKVYHDVILEQCNSANSLYAQGFVKEAFALLNSASMVAYNSQRFNEYHFNLDKKIGELIESLKSIEQTALTGKDEVIIQRSQSFLELATKTIEDDISYNKIVKEIVETKKFLNFINEEDNIKLKEYYDGLMFGLLQSYDTAVMVNSRTFQLVTPVSINIVSHLVSLIPLVGSDISSALKSTTEFIYLSQTIKAATNLCKLTTSKSEFETLAQNCTRTIIDSYSEQIKMLTPEFYILPEWNSRFDVLLNWARDKYNFINVKLYGERNETPMQKLGYKMAAELISRNISSGEFYEEKPAIYMSSDAKEQKLFKAMSKIMNEDIFNNHNERVVERKEIHTKNNCCVIYSITDIIYDNPLLNVHNGLSIAAEIFGVSEKELLNITCEDSEFAQMIVECMTGESIILSGDI